MRTVAEKGTTDFEFLITSTGKAIVDLSINNRRFEQSQSSNTRRMDTIHNEAEDPNAYRFSGRFANTKRKEFRDVD